MLKVKDCFSIFIFFHIYFRHFWRKTFRTLVPEFHPISSFWPSLPSGIDAAYEVTSRDSVFIFKGNYYVIISLIDEINPPTGKLNRTLIFSMTNFVHFITLGDEEITGTGIILFIFYR